MPQHLSKNSKRKYGLGAPAYTPKYLAEATEEANIPLWQPNGTIKYVSKADFDWLVKKGKIDLPKMPEAVPVKKEEN
jgi:hypothetical protein